MRWRRIRILVLSLLLLINLGLLFIRMDRRADEIRDSERSLETVLRLYEQRGIDFRADADALAPLKGLSSLTLGREKQETLPESVFAHPARPLTKREAALLLAETAAEHWYGRSFALLEEGETESGWRFVFCLNEKGVLCLYDRTEVHLSHEGIEQAVRCYRTARSGAAEEPSSSVDELLSRALWQLARGDFEACALTELRSVYRVEEDRAVPAARFVFENELGEETVLLIDVKK